MSIYSEQRENQWPKISRWKNKLGTVEILTLESYAAKTHLLTSELLSYQMRDLRVGPCQTFFWYNTNYIFVISSLHGLYFIVDAMPKEGSEGSACQSFFWYDSEEDFKRCISVACNSLYKVVIKWTSIFLSGGPASPEWFWMYSAGRRCPGECQNSTQRQSGDGWPSRKQTSP